MIVTDGHDVRWTKVLALRTSLITYDAACIYDAGQINAQTAV